ncbi:dimethylarginine dimethylaminohydrolase family protein [Bacillus sp. 1P06AnD]|uniref:dimethylarginine dimethylaminohydrolase family protein n=1 Tax=Bacillus sp. 1P06AnD TaxID=3132208 RepID=UPI0039A0EFA5
MFKHVIVKNIGKSFVGGLTTSDLGVPDFNQALIQHQAYIDALKACGVEITELGANEEFPDSCFVEDTAVLTEKCAIITNPGAESRNGEKDLMAPVVKQFYSTIEYIQSPGCLDGGDVLQVEDHFYIGLSDRTNEEGAQQLKAILEKYEYTAEIVPLKQFFHLKTGIAYLGNKDLVVAGEFIEDERFAGFNKIIIPAEDEYSANCIRVNDYVILPKGYENTKKKIEEAGYSTIEVDMTEFRKQDGGLSCLSLRF